MKSDLRFPIFIDINDKKIVVIGGGTIATRRVEKLIPFGAKVTVIAPEITEDLKALLAEGKICWMEEGYKPGQITDAYMVLAATNSPEVDMAVYEESKALKIMVNIASDQSKCDFFFPGIVQQDEFVVGLSASGKNHAKVKKVSEELRKQFATIRVGSRESKLAVVQSQMVIDYLKKQLPLAKTDIELVTMKTTGDKILDRNLDQIGGKGLFVKELDRALMDHRSDLSVHSLKDMPMIIPDDLPLLGFSRREDPRDVLVLPKGTTEWDMTKPVGCSSRRRIVQLQRLYPNLTFRSVRGNVITRLNKLDSGEYGALILAAAGLKRLGLGDRISRYFEPEEMIPAAGQAILAIQGRAGEDYSYMEGFFDPKATVEALAERAFVRTLDGGCSSPIAAYAKAHGSKVHLRGLYYSEARQDFIIGEITGPTQDAEELGAKLAVQLKTQMGD